MPSAGSNFNYFHENQLQSSTLECWFTWKSLKIAGLPYEVEKNWYGKNAQFALRTTQLAGQLPCLSITLHAAAELLRISYGTAHRNRVKQTDLQSKLHERVWTDVVLLDVVPAELVEPHIVDVQLRSFRSVLCLCFIDRCTELIRQIEI